VQTAAGDAIIKPMFSPDGRWVAYTAVRGDFEVFVEPNPPTGGRWQASTQGGHWPLWSGDGKYLFYVDGNNDVVRTAASHKNGFQAQATRVFFKGIYLTPGSASDYAASHDGRRILMMRPAEGPDAPTRMVIVLNWRQELDKVAPKSQ